MSDGEFQVAATNKKSQDEDETPMWVKVFGGSILSIAFLCAITITGYIVNNLNGLQVQINTLNTQILIKSEYNETQKHFTEMFQNQIKICENCLVDLKQRINTLEQLNKDRQGNIDQQILQLRDEQKSLVKDIQSMRERIASIEAKMIEKSK
jgi:hypothetical protein